MRLLAATALAAGTVALVTPDATSPAAAVPVVAGQGSVVAGQGSMVPGQGSVVPGQGSESTAAPPVRIRVPEIGVDSPLVELGIDRTGALVPPADFARAGWFAGGPVPGRVGPSVIAGHVDSRTGPAVFFRLDELVAGDDVLVDRSDGTTARFVVTGAGRFPKDRFPTDAVYGPTPHAQLSLITCGGQFDRERRSYRDNVVVTARLAG